MEADGYQTVSGGSISVTNVVDSTSGDSYTNGQTLLISFDFNATVAVVSFNGSVVLALFNETIPADIDSSEAYIRLIDLASTSNFVTLASTAGSIASYVGSYVCTPYVAMNPSVTALRVFDSVTGTYNTPSVTLSASFVGGDAYTVFYFTPTSGPAATVIYDRSLTGSSAAPANSSSSGVVSGSTPGASTASIFSTDSTNQNSAASLKFFALLAVISAVFAL